MPQLLAVRERDARERTGVLEEDLRSRVTMSRNDPRDFGHRDVFARLDGTIRLSLPYTHSITLEIEPGRHHLWIHNTLMWKNLEFTIEPGEHLEFQCINHGSWYTWGLIAVLGTSPLFLKVERRSRR